jgi:hypothetical protein
MPAIARDEIQRRIKAGEDIADLFLVSGIIINGWNGPQRWSESFSAPSARVAEDEARDMVAAECVNGRYGRLWVANVLQLAEDGWICQVDDYAFFADDPDRPEKYQPADGWTPPAGWEGTEGSRMRMPAMRDPRIYQ